MRKAPLVLIAAGLIAAFGLGSCGNPQCPCGFDYDPLTRGCSTHLGPVNCGGGNGGGSVGGSGRGSGDGSSGVVTPFPKGSLCAYSMSCRYDSSSDSVILSISVPGPVTSGVSGAPNIYVSATRSYTQVLTLFTHWATLSGVLTTAQSNMRIPVTGFLGGGAGWNPIPWVGGWHFFGNGTETLRIVLPFPPRMSMVEARFLDPSCTEVCRAHEP